MGVNEGIEFLKQKVEHIRPRLRTMKVLSDSASPEAQAQARKDLGDAISKLEDRLERMSLDIKEVGWKMGDHLQLDGGPAESRRGLEVYIAPPDGRI